MCRLQSPGNRLIKLCIVNQFVSIYASQYCKWIVYIYRLTAWVLLKVLSVMLSGVHVHKNQMAVIKQASEVIFNTSSHLYRFTMYFTGMIFFSYFPQERNCQKLQDTVRTGQK
jgi:hypothetical protein